MNQQATALHEASLDLDGLIADLASGAHAGLAQHLAPLASASRALEGIREARLPVAAELEPALLGIRRRLDMVGEMLAHAQQVHTGLADIYRLLWEADTGSQYSASGAPALSGPRRLIQEA